MYAGKSWALVQIHNKNNTIYSKITYLQVAYEIRNQFDIGLNATYAKLSGKWNDSRSAEIQTSPKSQIKLPHRSEG